MSTTAHRSSKSPIRPGSNPSVPSGGEVYLLSTEEDHARGALQENLNHILSKYNEQFPLAEIRLIPAGDGTRNTDYYIFPFLFLKLHSVGHFEGFIKTGLAEALAGRTVSVRMIRDPCHQKNWTMFYIDIATRSPEPEPSKPNNSGQALFRWLVIFSMLAFFFAHRLIIKEG